MEAEPKMARRSGSDAGHWSGKEVSQILQLMTACAAKRFLFVRKIDEMKRHLLVVGKR